MYVFRDFTGSTAGGIAAESHLARQLTAVHLVGADAFADGGERADGYLTAAFEAAQEGAAESFAANLGGRVIGTAAAWFTITLSESNPPSAAKIAIVGACVAGIYALIGAILSFMLPEPKAESNE